MWLLTYLLFFSFSLRISSVCRQSFQTLCDNFEDYYPIIDKVSELIVGSEISESSQMMSLDSDTILFYKLVNLKSLTILGRVNDLQHFIFLGESDKGMDYLKFYGNNIRRLRTRTFMFMQVRRFSFENNNLEVLQAEAFEGCSFLTLDLSHNKLEEIEDNVLSDKTLREFGTEELIITHNKLTNIAENSFTSYLKILKLDYNNLYSLKGGVLDNLKSLQELTVSHNMISSIPNLDHAQNLSYIDFSFNDIIYVRYKDFEKLQKLVMINLNNNKISNPDILNAFKPPMRPITEIKIALAFNHLTHLTRNSTLKNLTPILYGNPWNCKCWPRIQKLFPKRDECDLQFFGSGEAPYCIDISGDDCTSKLNETNVRAVSSFLNLRENAKVNCSLESGKPRVFVF